MHGGFEIDVDHGVDLGRIDFLERRLRRQDAGVVDQDIDLDVGERDRNGLCVAHVRLNRGDAADPA